ncbi:MAG: flagellar filament capping protein FliD [Sphingomonas fennica]
MTSISSTLGVGSGIDTSSLIEKLATAAKEPKEAAIKARETANSARISSLATVSNALSGFSTALTGLVEGGSLSTQPTTSDAAVLTAKAQPGARIANLSARVEVTQLATAQSLVSGYAASAGTAIGQGTITLGVGSRTMDLTVGPDNDSLSGLARSINAAGLGITASVVTDSAGARLTLKGETGAAAAFTLTPAAGTATGLADFAYPPAGDPAKGMTLAQGAQDALLKMDGVSVSRATNTIDDLVSGVTLELKDARPGTAVSIGATRPTAALGQAVNDFVGAYNELMGILKAQTTAGTTTDADGKTVATGVLSGESALRDMKRQLAGLTSMKLNSGGGVATLAEIGVVTNRDGTLTVNKTRLEATIAADPAGIEAMFNPGQYSSNPLVQITSPMGRAKPGTYEVTDVTPQAGGTSAQGKIAGEAALTTGEGLVASVKSPASGLVLKPLGAVARATITVDIGIAGALKSIRDALLADQGGLSTTTARYTAESKTIAADRTKMTDADTTLRSRLTRSFSGMDKRVAAYKATQSFLEQQVNMWTKSDS